MGESSESIERCAVCGHEERPAAEGRLALRAVGLSRVIIEGRALLLCRAHAATVVAAMPETFEDLRALFVGAAPPPRPRDLAPDGSAGPEPRASSIERRSPVTRRGQDDRRVFPPRPEGRRRSAGRRATDPCD